MNKHKYVYVRLVEFLDNDKFCHWGDECNGDRFLKSFTYIKDFYAFILVDIAIMKVCKMQPWLLKYIIPILSSRDGMKSYY